MVNTHKKKVIEAIIIAFLILLIIASFLFIYLWEQDNSKFDADSDFEMADTIEFEGMRYTLRSDVETLLIIGVDKFESSSSSVESYNNDKCADFIVLFVIDRKANSYSTVYLNRDTITDVTVLGIGGKKVGKVKEQLSLSHTYGEGSDDSARNTARAVSAIFGGLRIDRYVTLTMEAAAILNDTVGGVTLTVSDDLSSVDPAFVKGETVTLRGEQALLYVRARYGLEDASNAARMKRQQQYIDALYSQLLTYLDENESLSSNVILDLSEYMVTNCSSSELERMLSALSGLEKRDSYSMSGEYKINKYVEFYPYESSVKSILVNLFYKIKE